MLDHLMPLISSPWLYVIVFLLVAFDGFVPVAMSEAILIGLAAISATGNPDIAVLAGAAIAGGMVGDRLSYYVGGKAGGRIKNGKLAAAKVKAEQALLRQGGAAIVIGRFIPYGRTATTLTAGSVSLPLGPFYAASALSSLLWAAYSIGLGRLGGMAFADSPLLAAGFGIALGFLLAGLHTAAKRLGVLIVPAVARFRARRRPEPLPTGDGTGAARGETGTARGEIARGETGAARGEIARGETGAARGEIARGETGTAGGEIARGETGITRRETGITRRETASARHETGAVRVDLVDLVEEAG